MDLACFLGYSRTLNRLEAKPVVFALPSFFLNQRIERCCLIFAGRFRRALDAYGDVLLPVLDTQLVAGFDGAARLGLAAVDPYASLLRHIFGDGAPLDKPGDFKELIEPQLLDGFFQLVAGFECRNFGFRNADFFARLRVAARAAGTGAGFERAEADQLNFVAGSKRIGNFAQETVKYGFHVSFSQAALRCNVVNQVIFVHRKFLPKDKVL